MVYTKPKFTKPSRAHIAIAKRSNKNVTSAWSSEHPFVLELVKKLPIDENVTPLGMMYARNFRSLYTVLPGGIYICLNPPSELIEISEISAERADELEEKH